MAGAHHFADRLISGVRAVKNPLCVGLDPHLARIPPLFRRGDMAPHVPATAEAVGEFCGALLNRLPGRVAVIKTQVALFEQLGWRGFQVLEGVLKRAGAAGLHVIVDAKRGDIGSTAEGYASAYLEPASPFSGDALTLNPYMGRDTLSPFLQRAERHGRGVFVLVKTSNPGSGDLQDRVVDGRPLFVVLADSLRQESDKLRGEATGWSSLGVVVGATYPEQALAVREVLPNSVFLIPGYGAQGGSARDAVGAFVPGPSGREGGVVNSSRGVLFPPKADTDSASVWEAAIDEALDQATTELGEAVHA